MNKNIQIIGLNQYSNNLEKNVFATLGKVFAIYWNFASDHNLNTSLPQKKLTANKVFLE